MKRILSLLLSAILLLSISFTTFAESNVITTNIQTLEKSDEKCVVKETRTDSIIISTNDKVNNTLTIETYDISDKRKLNTQTYFLNVLEKNIELNNKIELLSGDEYEHTFSDREYDIYFEYESHQWQIRSKNERKLGYESTVNDMSYLENFRLAVKDVNSAEKNIIGSVGSTVAVTAIAAYLTGGIGAGSAAAGGSAAIVAAFTDLDNACDNADYYFGRVEFAPY